MSNGTTQQESPGKRSIFHISKKDKPRRLEGACYGNAKAGSLLDYFAYGVEKEIDYGRQDEGCKVVTLQRIHKDIMEKLPFNVCEKTLIRLLNLLNEWGYVTSEPYSRDFTVYGEKIQEGLKNPPKRPERPYYDRHPQKDSKDKGCTSTTLQPSEEKVVVSTNVVEVNKKVVTLQDKVVELQQKVDTFTTLQPHLEALVELYEAHKSDLYRTNRSITGITGEDIADKTASPTIEAIASHPLFQSLFDLVNSQAKQLAEMKSQLDHFTSKQQPTGDTHVPNPSSSPTSTGPDTVPTGDVRDNPEPNTANSTPDASSGNTGKEVVSGHTDTPHIAKEATSENVESKATGNEETDVSGKGKQETLFEAPDSPPVMPPESMSWSAEKLVQITEAKRFVKDSQGIRHQGQRFSEKVYGKSGTSQRDRQKEAAKKIIALDVTEEQYIMAYDVRNDKWWNDEKSSLTVETMLAKTPRKIIRVIELLEEIESKGGKPSQQVISFAEKQQERQQTQEKRQPMKHYTDEEWKQELKKPTVPEWLRKGAKQDVAIG
jgi:hypothetical protein